MSRELGIAGAALALLGSIGASHSVRADPDEAWLRRVELPNGVRPLLALVLDRSLATARTIAVDEDYDALRAYAPVLSGAIACDPARAYFRRGPGPAPDCALQAGLEMAPRSRDAGLQCESARTALGVSGFYVASRAAQWRAAEDGGYWDALEDGSADAVECRADDPAIQIDWDRPPFAHAYIFYSGNFLNYLRSAHAQTDRSIADVAAGRLSRALASTDGLDVALIRVDDDGPDGGYVASAPVASAAAATLLQSISTAAPAGSAPLAETLTEAALWLGGGVRRFGVDGRADPAAYDSPATGTYRSPFDHACRPVSLTFVTAGEASDDESAASAAAALPGFEEETGGCGADCLGTLASWLGGADLSGDLPGAQSVPVSLIAPPGMALAGERASLADPLAYVNLVVSAFQRDALVAAGPQLSTAGLVLPVGGAGQPGVIYGLMAPRPRERWPGNLLRYALRAPAGPLAPPLVVDREGNPAIDEAAGVPRPGTWSLWSDAPDANLLAGGAAGRLPPADARSIYTDVASTRLCDPDNRLAPGNARIDRAMIGLGATDPESLDDALAWAAAERTLGDPGLDVPAVVEYPEAGIRVAFAATQDGLLHAFDADSGVELWAWMPRELLPRVPALMRNAETTARSHGIDGPLVVHRHDPDRDGRIDRDAGEHLWLLFGLGRGGGRYYALDVADHDDPRLLWSFELPHPGVESLAESVITRLAIESSGQSAGDWIVLLSGGYDRRFDAAVATGAGAGSALHVVDAATARLLWSAGSDGDHELPGIASLPSAARALDLDGDGHLDRAYIIDVTGDLWHVDFRTGSAADELATARRLARLGDGARRFLTTPDVSITRIAGATRISIAVGSGWTRRPRDATIEDRVYVIFDDTAANAAGEITEADLFDATDAEDAFPPDAPGWFRRLAAHGAGEKVAGPVVTFDHVLHFQTYQPLPPDADAPCGPPRSVSRRYALDLRTALPLASTVESEEEEPDEIAATGLPPGLRFGFPGRWEEPCEGCRPRPFGILGGETFDPGYAGDPVRTSWRKLAPPPASP